MGSLSTPAPPFDPAERNPTLRLGREISGELENLSEGQTKNDGWPLLCGVVAEHSIIHVASTEAITTIETTHNCFTAEFWKWEDAGVFFVAQRPADFNQLK